MKTSWVLVAAMLVCVVTAVVRGADDKLAGIVVAGEDWQVAVTGVGFADGLSSEPGTGEIFFSDMRGKGEDKPGVYRLSPDLKKQRLFDGKFSGTRPSADGKILYAIGDKKLFSFTLPDGKETVLADRIGTNDLAVASDGRIYFTGHGKAQVSLYNPKTKAVTAADTGSLKNPNGIGLTADGQMLVVSDYGGVNVVKFAVRSDGTLEKKSAMTMKAPENKPDVANGDGLAIDAAGRVFVTTAVGLQVFSPEGELLGVLAKPKPGSMISCAFGGKNSEYLYVSCGDTIYRRKVGGR
jgi:enterochelin esterase family protein